MEIIEIEGTENSVVTISNVTVVDTNIGIDSSLLKLEGVLNSTLVIDGMTLQNVKMSYGNEVVDFSKFKQVTLRGVHISQTDSLNSLETHDVLVHRDYSDSSEDTQFTFENVVIESSCISMLKIQNHIRDIEHMQSFIARNISYKGLSDSI